jgi:molybdenum cofactor cytidylyltransferase
MANHFPGKIVYPVYQGRRGHPPLIPTSLIPGILTWEKEGGLKSFLKMYEKIAVDLPVNDEFILKDIDTPDDYKQLTNPGLPG